jgi:hypothetical protein
MANATQGLGQCPKCGELNTYSTTVCVMCGARLPWADALDDDRRKAIAAQQAADALQAQQARQAQIKQTATAVTSFLSPPPPPAGTIRPGDMICGDCGYLGKPKQYSQFNLVIGLALFCAGIFPALIYAIWAMSTNYRGCPQCRGKNMLPLRTPGGKKLYQEYYG